MIVKRSAMRWLLLMIIPIILLLLEGCYSQKGMSHHHAMGGQETTSSNIEAGQDADISYALTTMFSGGKLAFVDESFEQNGTLNPTLEVQLGQIVEVKVINGDGITHDLIIPEIGIQTERISQINEQTVITFKAEQLGDFAYYCSIPGHRQAGMEGLLRVQK